MTFDELRRAVGTFETAEEQLGKSLPTGVRGLRGGGLPSVEHVEGALQLALAHGALPADVCQHAATALSLGGVQALPQSIMDVLAGK